MGAHEAIHMYDCLIPACCGFKVSKKVGIVPEDVFLFIATGCDTLALLP